jgi:cytochrome bd ubiquinol oxidase subunit II
MDVTWLCLLGVTFSAYLALDGFVIGAGMLLPLAGPDEAARRSVFTAFGPFFLGNEVWLVVTGGTLTATFPLLESTLFGGLQPVLATGLLIWVLRDASVWFRSRTSSPAWRRSWDRLLTGTGTALAAGWGLVVGALLAGLPGDSLIDHLLHPYALLWAVTLPVLLVAHGAGFLALRLPAAIAGRFPKTGGRACLAGAVLLPVAVLTAPFTAGGLDTTQRVVFVLGGLVSAGALLVAARALARGNAGASFAATSAALAGPVILLGARLSPQFLDAAADSASLAVLGRYAAVALPAAILAQGAAGVLFRRRVSADTPAFF